MLHGLALARLGKLDQARAIAANLELSKECPGIVCYHAARLQALLGEPEQALKTLVCAFECTPAGELVRLKEQAKACTDLGNLRSSDGFVKALQTESKIKAGCGGCTQACPSKSGSDKKTDGCTEHAKPKSEPCEHGKH